MSYPVSHQLDPLKEYVKPSQLRLKWNIWKVIVACDTRPKVYGGFSSSSYFPKFKFW
jgi:hypothetical protein